MLTRVPVMSGLVVALLAAGCGGSGDAAGGRDNAAKPGAIAMKDIRFTPPATTVKVGQVVTWTNQEGVQHNVKATAGASFASALLSQGGTFRFTPTKPGTIKFVCTIHPGMTGTITVTR